MAFRRLSMRKIHSTVRLFFEAGLSIRAIARTLRVSPAVPAKAGMDDSIRRAQVAGLSWPLPEGLDERALEARLFLGPACDAGLGARSRRVAAQGGHPVAAVAGVQGRASRGASVQPVLRALPRLRPRRRWGHAPQPPRRREAVRRRRRAHGAHRGPGERGAARGAGVRRGARGVELHPRARCGFSAGSPSAWSRTICARR